MNAEHPFAQYVRILGKGPRLSRTLTEAESYEAARMIMAGEVEPVQLGAFLCLVRMTTETPEEMAGFTKAMRQAVAVAVPAETPRVDLDWPSYAGKKNRLPWFLLSALLLADNGIRVFMHGEDGHTVGRLYAADCLDALGVSVDQSLADAARHLEERNFAYMPLSRLSPRLHELMGLKPLIGLRNPFHSIVRELNPFGAACQIIGVAHPFYQPLHQSSGLLVGQPRQAVFKGDGGEAERRPEKPCEVAVINGNEAQTETWPPMREAPAPKDTYLRVERLTAVWNRTIADEAGEAAVIGTAAIALKALGRVTDQREALDLASTWWAARRRNGRNC